MATLDDLVPTPEQVHSLIPTRPAFTATSVPTRGQVVELVRQAASDVFVDLPEGLGPGPVLNLARWAVSLNAASYVEAAFYPEQAGGDGSTSTLLHDRYVAVLSKLRAEVGGEDPGAGGGGSARGAVTRAVSPLLAPSSTGWDLVLP